MLHVLLELTVVFLTATTVMCLGWLVMSTDDRLCEQVLAEQGLGVV